MALRIPSAVSYSSKKLKGNSEETGNYPQTDARSRELAALSKKELLLSQSLLRLSESGDLRTVCVFSLHRTTGPGWPQMSTRGLESACKNTCSPHMAYHKNEHLYPKRILLHLKLLSAPSGMKKSKNVSGAFRVLGDVLVTMSQ